jgi:hypothetical protein
MITEPAVERAGAPPGMGRSGTFAGGGGGGAQGDMGCVVGPWSSECCRAHWLDSHSIGSAERPAMEGGF